MNRHAPPALVPALARSRQWPRSNLGKRMRQAGALLSWLISPALLLALWAAVAHAAVFPAHILVPPLQVVTAFEELLDSGELAEHLGYSLGRLGLGFAFGASAGLAFGVLMALSGRVKSYCAPTFHALRQIPSLALIPMFVLLFGIEETFKIVIVAKAAFFPVALAATQGVNGIPSHHFEVARVLRLPRTTLLKDIAFPAAAPPIITGLRIGLTRAWLVLIAAELLAADSGLGQMIEMSRQMLRIDVVMVGVLVTGVIGFLLDLLLRQLENHLLRWKRR